MKKCLLLEINTILMFLSFKMKYIIDGVFISLLASVITAMRKLAYLLYELFIHKIIFLCLLKFTRTLDNIKYCVKRHIATLEHCFSCKLSSAYSL